MSSLVAVELTSLATVAVVDPSTEMALVDLSTETASVDVVQSG